MERDQVNAAQKDRWEYMRYLVEKYAEPESERELLLAWLKEREEEAKRDA